MRAHRPLLALLTTAALSMSLVACSNDAATTGSSESTQASVSAETGTRTITDIEGTAVEVPAEVNRIADLWHANNQIVLILGGGDKLVATTQAIQGLPWFKVVYPRIAEVPAPVKGTDVNMEALLDTQPEVVISSNDQQVSDARAAGVPAAKVKFQNFDDLKRTVDITADVVGTQEAKDRAADYKALLDKNLELVTSRLKDVPENEKPSVLHIVGGDNLTKVDGSDSLIGEWMNVTGAKNAIDGVANLKEITLEEIIASDPDIIIIGGTKSQEGIDAIANDPAWANVKAVKENNLVKNPVGTFNWDRYSAEEALQVLWAAKLFYPDRFQDIDLVKETQDFYKKFYDYDLSADEAQRIIDAEAPAQ